MSRDFLSRWSQRKREADKGVETPPEAEVSPSAGESLLSEAAEAEIPPEELEALPAPEEITPETDITAFLRKGVPDALRNAALRRVWTLDPVIRDYVNPAREYAYDWNVPGGVPGTGPLLPTDDVAAMVRKVFGDPTPEEAGEGEASASSEGDSLPGLEGEKAEETSAETPPEVAAPALKAPAEPELLAVRLGRDNEEQAPVPVEESRPAPPRKRHGGAMPI